jgi:hypothetical protein
LQKWNIFARNHQIKKCLLFRCRHRIDTGPEGTLLQYVFWFGKNVRIFLRSMTPSCMECTRHFVPMFVLWKTSMCTPGLRHMMAYFHVSTRKISDEISCECPFWSSILCCRHAVVMQSL